MRQQDSLLTELRPGRAPRNDSSPVDLNNVTTQYREIRVKVGSDEKTRRFKVRKLTSAHRKMYHWS